MEASRKGRDGSSSSAPKRLPSFCFWLATSLVSAGSSNLFAHVLLGLWLWFSLLEEAKEPDGTAAAIAFDDDNCDDFNLEPELMRRLTILPWFFTSAFGIAFLRRMGLLGNIASETLDVITRLWAARGIVLPFLVCPPRVSIATADAGLLRDCRMGDIGTADDEPGMGL